jgi:hypothetical protein
MTTVTRSARRVLSDLRSLRNLDAYVVAAIGVVLIALDVIGTVDLDAYLSVMTAALVVLLFRTTVPPKVEVDLDNVLHDRQSFVPLREFIRGGREVWVYGPSAVNVLSDSPDLKREVLDRGGSLRVLLQDPKADHSMAILHQQLGSTNVLEHDIEGSLYKLEKMRSWGSIDYRLLPYNPGFSLLVVDPDGKDGRLIIEFFGYRNEFITDRMHLQIERRTSQFWFEYWAKQFQIMWDAAREHKEA